MTENLSVGEDKIAIRSLRAEVEQLGNINDELHTSQYPRTEMMLIRMRSCSEKVSNSSFVVR